MKAGMIKFACTCGGVMFKGSAAGLSLSPLGIIALTTIAASTAYVAIKNTDLLGPTKALVVSKKTG